MVISLIVGLGLVVGVIESILGYSPFWGIMIFLFAILVSLEDLRKRFPPAEKEESLIESRPRK